MLSARNLRVSCKEDIKKNTNIAGKQGENNVSMHRQQINKSMFLSKYILLFSERKIEPNLYCTFRMAI